MSKLRYFRKVSHAPQALTPDELQISINKSAEHLRVLWISYSLFAVYLIITSLSVTHRHLFLELPLRLPVLNIDLGLQDFFIAAPILFIGMHLYLVFHVNLLRQQITKYQDIIQTQTTIREKKSYLFDPFVFLQSWVGHAKGWRSQLGFSIITHGSLKVFSIFVLLLIMLSALPYHDEKLTHYHRIMVMLDFVVIAVFAVNWRKKLQHLIRRILITSTAFIGLFISLYGILIFQGEDLYKLREEGFYTQEQPYKEQDFPFLNRFIPVLKIAHLILEPLKPYLKASTKSLLEGEANYVTGKPESLFSNRLILVNEDFTEDKILDEVELREDKNGKNTSPEAILQDIPYKMMLRKTYKMILRKRGRHFENAVFDYSNLPRTDFTGAYISNASFLGSNLEKSNFSCSNLPDKDKKDTPRKKCLAIQHRNVNFQYANLKKSNFHNITLQDVNLSQGQLQNADLTLANLQNVNLFEAELQGANLGAAQLHGADLSSTQLQGANLTLAQLQGANLSGAELQGAEFRVAQLQGANLSSAQLQGAILPAAQLQGANLSGAQLQGADLRIAKLQGANLSCTNLEYTDLNSANIWNSFFSCNGSGNINEFYDGQKRAFLQAINFKYDEQTWFEGILKIKEYRLKKCSEKDGENKKVCVHDTEEWFKEIFTPRSEQVEGRKIIWQEAQNNSIYNDKKDYDKFMEDFLQYYAEKLLCKNIINIDTVIKKLDYNEKRKIFAQTLFKKIDDEEQAENCKLDPPLTNEQRTTLEGWLKASD